MKKAMIEAHLKHWYNTHDYTKGYYIVGTYEHGMIFVHVLDNFHFVELAHLDQGSRGSGACLKYRQTKKTVEIIRASATYSFPLCTLEMLEAVARAYGKQANRGKAFEKLVTEYFGQVWEDDHIPFWEAGDIELNGQAYQIKYDRCNFCNEKQMLNFEGQTSKLRASIAEVVYKLWLDRASYKQYNELQLSGLAAQLNGSAQRLGFSLIIQFVG